jgi:hypothetical protein
LDPVGRFRLPRRATLLRLVLVAVLLLTAAGALRTGAAGPATAEAPSRSGRPTTPPEPLPAAAPPAAAPGAGWGAEPGAAPGVERPRRLPIPDGLVGVPVRLADPASLAMLQPGDRVDLLALPANGDPVPVAGEVLVLALDHTTAALLLALSASQGNAVMAATTGTGFGVILRR